MEEPTTAYPITEAAGYPPSERPPHGGSRFGRLKPSWLAGGAAALAAIGLGIAALVVALNNNGSTSTSASTSASTSVNTGSCSITRVADQELPSVVTVQATPPTGAGAGAAGSTGSGEVIDNKGHILTNNHVIASSVGGGSVTIEFANGHTEPAKLVGRDPQTDVAVLQVPDPSGLRPIQFGNSGNLQVGQPVIALGAPLGLSSTVTSGIVSALDRSVDVPSDNGSSAILVSAIQTDAAINPGNSGGALVDCSGHLIGVPSAGATVPTPGGGTSAGSIGIGFAIPSDFARRIADELISTGKANHGSLGIAVVTVPTGNGSATGLHIVSVTPGGPAAKAGLHPGDIITAVNGTPTMSATDLLTVTLSKQPGSTVTITYERNGTTHHTKVTLGSR